MFIPKVDLAAEIFRSQTVDPGGLCWSVPCSLYPALAWTFSAVVYEDRINLLGYRRTSKKYIGKLVFSDGCFVRVIFDFHETVLSPTGSCGSNYPITVVVVFVEPINNAIQFQNRFLTWKWGSWFVWPEARLRVPQTAEFLFIRIIHVFSHLFG